MPIAIGFMDDDDEPIIHFSDEEKGGFPNVDAVLNIVVPAAQKCCQLWDPVNARIDQQTFSTYFTSSMYSALQVCLRGDSIDFSDSIEPNVPHIEAAAAILETAIEQCCLIWPETNFDSLHFTAMAGHLMHLAALKVYCAGRNDPDILNGFPDSQMISLSKEEKSVFPDADYVLDMLIPPLQKCFHLWDPLNADADERAFLTRLADSIDSASRVYSDHKSKRDFLAQIDVPYVESAIPILADAFKKCRLVWAEADYDHAAFVSMVSRYMSIIAFRMYRNG